MDITGAIGLARSFMIAGQYDEKVYLDNPLDQYIKDNLDDGKSNGRIKQISKHAPNIEFEIKLKYISDKLYTQKAKEIAKQRIEYMEQFFGRLEREIRGEI